MSLQGNFSDVIDRMDNELRSVRAIWTDMTAITYDGINENMKLFAGQMWNAYENAQRGHSLVKANYNAGEFENRVQACAAEAASV